MQVEKSELDPLGVLRVESYGAKMREDPGSAWGRGRRCKDRGRRRGSGTPQCGWLGPTVWEMVCSGVKTSGTEVWVGRVSKKGGKLDGQSTQVQDLVSGSRLGKRLRRGRSGACVRYSVNGRGPGSEGVRVSRLGPTRAPGGIRSKRRGGVWRAGVRLRVPGCLRRRALTRGPAVGAVSVAGARRLQQLQQPLLVALAVAHGRLRGLSGAQPGCHPAGGSP